MRGFARVSVAVPPCRVGAVDANRDAILSLMQEAHDAHCHLCVFPELALSSYTARDLFFDRRLLDDVEAALGTLVEKSAGLRPLFAVGLPFRARAGLYNTAAVFQDGRLLGLVPKSYLPNYREFEERRWFRPGTEVAAGTTERVLGDEIPFGTDLLFEAKEVKDLVVGFEVCEDFWVQVPPSALLASMGATVLANLSASNFTIGKADLRRLLARSQSDRAKCAYLYVAAGPGESSTDLAFDADAFVCENGNLLAQSKRFSREPQLVVQDVDLELLAHERLVAASFGDCAAENRRDVRRVAFNAAEAPGLEREVTPHPFLPNNEETLHRRCWEIFEIQTNALLTRMEAIGQPKLILGLSGGLDSTHAALVSAQALDLGGRGREDLVCVTMPGLGTSDETYQNAVDRAAHLGATLLEIPVSEASRLVLGMTEHESADGADDVAALIERLRTHPELGDPTVQNVQARLRTLVLMTLANHRGGIVVGTGDLSEKALGWSTYAGDQIAMYDVNAGVPKTLIQFVIRWVINERLSTWSAGEPALLAETLASILDTPISPELLPTDVDGAIAHLTEAEIGPYELHDFFLFHFVREGARPGRILDLARVAFEGRYPLEELARWLGVFVRRFFTQQYKRSCTADAPKVGLVALSPRGDWRMPSDASPAAWLAEIDAYLAENG